jgi:hypothetical protein
MKLPVIDAIWRARGEFALESSLAAQAGFARLDPLFQAPGTTYEVVGNTLTYSKKNPGAQDPFATFTSGTIRIEQREVASVLRYDVKSTALLLCFLAPLMFLGFAQLAVAANAWEKAGIEASDKAGKEEDKPKPLRKLNPFDEFLGAPQPEDPNKKKDKDEEEEPHSPTPAYVLAGLFFALYLVGRVLEPWLLRRRLRAALAVSDSAQATPVAPAPPAKV